MLNKKDKWILSGFTFCLTILIIALVSWLGGSTTSFVVGVLYYSILMSCIKGIKNGLIKANNAKKITEEFSSEIEDNLTEIEVEDGKDE